VRAGGVFRRTPDGEVTTVLAKRRGVGGIASHASGGLVLSGRNVCHVRDGVTRILFEDDNIPGFNDLIPDDAGRVWVGSMLSSPFEPGDRVPGDAYRVDAEGVAVRRYGGVTLTNGIGFSPDGASLYHSDTAAHCVIVHDVDSDGTATNRRTMSAGARFSPDGLAVDEAGQVWVADYGAGCVRVFSASGEVVAHIAVPARAVTSLCFGGADRRDLYVVSADNTDDPARGGSVFRSRVDVPGLAIPLVRI
jgi:sugar lactone lactonase YvrE